jgi:hypothetical protein
MNACRSGVLLYCRNTILHSLNFRWPLVEMSVWRHLANTQSAHVTNYLKTCSYFDSLTAIIMMHKLQDRVKLLLLSNNTAKSYNLSTLPVGGNRSIREKTCGTFRRASTGSFHMILNPRPKCERRYL